jgi:hypothetical protein
MTKSPFVTLKFQTVIPGKIYTPGVSDPVKTNHKKTPFCRKKWGFSSFMVLEVLQPGFKAESRTAFPKIFSLFSGK